MRANDRLNEIVKLLNKQGRVHVKSLSEMFEVTEDLIRKDLKKLEEKDLIDRIYGGAERKSKKFDASNVKYRMNIHKDEKNIIANFQNANFDIKLIRILQNHATKLQNDFTIDLLGLKKLKIENKNSFEEGLKSIKYKKNDVEPRPNPESSLEPATL